jgi:hypothetical protein
VLHKRIQIELVFPHIFQAGYSKCNSATLTSSV